MPVLSAPQIAGYASAAGFTGRSLTLAVAVALAESGGRTDATHRNSNGSTDYGLWQINSVHGDLIRSGSWSNPADNARMAHSVYAAAGGSFRPWATYTSGRYLAFVGRASAASGNPAPPSAQGSATGVGFPNPLSPLVGISQFANLIANPHTWIRIAMFTAGGGLLVIGILTLTRLDNALGKAALNVGLAVATDGASVAAKGTRSAVRAVKK